MVDSDIINLLLIVEVISIVIATIVIALELWIHKSTVQILKRMDKFSIEMEKNIGKQIRMIDDHTSVLEDHVKDLDKHSHRMEKNIKELLKENEDIYKRVCQPFKD